MNTGKVYFSTNQRLNHAAINPAFSLMESLSKQKDFGKQDVYKRQREYRFRYLSLRYSKNFLLRRHKCVRYRLQGYISMHLTGYRCRIF